MKKNIISTIFGILIFTIIPVILCILVTSRTSAFFGIRSYTVLTGSMEPKVHVGSIVFAVPSTLYKVGDIITFNRGNITVTHRIHSIENKLYQTKGDANKVPDPQLVSKSNIIGKDYLIIPYIGKFALFLKTVPGFILFLGIPTIIFISLELLNIKKEIVRQTEERVRKQYEAQLNTQYEPTTT